MVNSRNIDDLHPIVALKCRKFIIECKKHEIDIIITSTYRDFESQTKLYAQGRTEPGQKVTNARAGYSFHNFKVAFDFVPIVNGKAQWNDTATFIKCGELAEKCELEWAGRWRTFKELAHCQYTAGFTLADFRAGKVISLV